MSETVESIESQIAELEAKKQAILAKDKDEKLVEAKAIIVKYGFTADDLGLSTKKKSNKPFIRYINPENPNETWVGRGKRPEWIVSYLEMGGKLEDVKALKPIRVK